MIPKKLKAPYKKKAIKQVKGGHYAIINPKDFASYADPMDEQREFDDDIIKQKMKQAKKGKIKEVPSLTIENDKRGAYVADHDGRHRARALEQLGNKEMLIQIKGQKPDSKTIRQEHAGKVTKAPKVFAKGGLASSGYGKRIDNTEKERGYLGEIRMPNGRDVMTEMSVGAPNTNELFRPAITPGMHPADINYIRELDKVPEDVLATSLRHAVKRLKEGKSPFWNAKEDLERQFINEDTIPHMAGAGSVTKAVEEINKAVKGAEAGEEVSSIAKSLPKMQAKEAVDLPVEPSVANLKQSFDSALQNHLSLDPALRARNTRDSRARVTEYVGTTGLGKPKDLLSQNQKLMKAERGYEDVAPLELSDGRGVETIGLSISPAYQEGKFNTCPNSMSCKSSCLGKTSGGNFQFGGGQDLEKVLGPRLVSYNKTQAMLRDPEAFAVRLNDEITAAKHIAAANGNHLGVRLNVLSDIHPKVYESLINAHPDVTFYDYTKLDADPIAPNHHLTYSSTGVTQPAGYNGLNEDVVNPYGNWSRMRRRLDKGDNITMVFSHKDILPSVVTDEETGKTYSVVDGDTHDFRPIDKTPEGVDGVIVGLRNKAMTTSNKNAAQKTNGFMVHYDPQVVKESGKIVRDDSGQPVFNNSQVVIPTQPKRTIDVQKKAEGGIVTNDNYGLDQDAYLQQFHNHHHFNDDHEGRPEWYELTQHFQAGGAVKKFPINLEQEFINADAIHMAGGGSSLKDIQSIAADPTAYFMNEMPTSEPSLKERARTLGHTAKASLEKELQSYKAKHAGTDIANDWIANLVGAPVDLTNMVLSPFGAGSEEPVMGSQFLKHKMHDYGMHTGTKRPWTEAGTAFVSPQSAVKGIAKAAEITKDMPVGMMIKDVSQGAQFVSPLEKTVNAHKMEAMPGPQWSSWLSANAPKGAKKEAEASGLHEWLKTQPKVSKGDIEAFLGENRPQVRKNVHGEYGGLSQDERQRFDELSGINFQNSGDALDARKLPDELRNEYYRLQNKHENQDLATITRWRDQYARDAQNDPRYQMYAERMQGRLDNFNPEDVVPENMRAKFKAYTEPGGENYKETTITLPRSPMTRDQFGRAMYPGARDQDKVDQAYKEYLSYAKANPKEAVLGDASYMVPSAHKYGNDTSDANRLVHYRTKDRETAEGKKALHVEELQSDWGQKGRDQGFSSPLNSNEMNELDELVKLKYADSPNGMNVLSPENEARYDELIHKEARNRMGVPSGPYVTDTKDWTALGLKHALKDAVDNGHDYLTFATGQQNADRYNLAKQIDELIVEKTPNGTYNMSATMPGGSSHHIGEGIQEHELEGIIGKDLAKKIVNQDYGHEVYDGNDLTVGGEGMKAYYDKILPQTMDDVLKQLGVKERVKPVDVKLGNEEDRNINHLVHFDGTESVEVDGSLYHFNNSADADAFKASLSSPSPHLGVEITPELREKILSEGLPHFQKGGKITQSSLEQEFKLNRYMR